MANKVTVLIDVVTDRANTALGGFRKSIGEADGALGKFKAGSSAAFASLKAVGPEAALAAGAALVTFDEDLPAVAPSGCGADEVLRLDAALHALALLSPRQASIVESRFFAGLEVAETAQVLGVSEATVARDWRVAKAWLSRELRKEPAVGSRAL